MIRADLHVHSCLNLRLPKLPFFFDSVQSEGQILQRCRQDNIRILAITSHDSLDGYYNACKLMKSKTYNVMLVPGIEVSTADGHVLAYNVTRSIPKQESASKTVQLIHAQGGFAVPAHPYHPKSVGNLTKTVSFDAIEAYNAFVRRRECTQALNTAQLLGLPITAGSDAHEVNEIGRTTMLFPDNVKTLADVFSCIRQKRYKIDYHTTRLYNFLPRWLAQNISIQVTHR